MPEYSLLSLHSRRYTPTKFTTSTLSSRRLQLFPGSSFGASQFGKVNFGKSSEKIIPRRQTCRGPWVNTLSAPYVRVSFERDRYSLLEFFCFLQKGIIKKKTRKWGLRKATHDSKSQFDSKFATRS